MPNGRLLKALAVFGLAGWALAWAVAWPPPGARAANGAGAAGGAAEAGLDLTVNPGWGGVARAGGWIPLVVTAGNRGPDLEAEAEAVVVALEGPDRVETAVHSRRLSLPGGTAKQFTVMVPTPTPSAREVEVRLVRRGRVLARARAPVEVLGWDWRLVAVLGRDAERLARGVTDAGGGPRRGRSALRGVPIRADELPDHPAYLDGFDAVEVHGSLDAPLGEAQRRALHAWVRRGGLLLLSAGARWGQARDLLPDGLREALPGGTWQAPTLSALGTLILPPPDPGSADGSGPAPPGAAVTANLVPGPGRPLALESGRPLALRLPYGEGEVVLLGPDLAAEPLASWPAAADLRRSLLAGAPRMAFSPPRADAIAGLAANAASELPGDVLPPAWALTLALGAFVLLAGPANLLVLRRLGRPEWFWLTAPAVSVLYVLGFYGIAFALGGRDLIASTYTVLWLDEGGGRAALSAEAVLFSPTRGSFALDLPPGLVVRATPPDPFRPVRRAAATVWEGTRPRVEFGPSGRWERRRLELQGEVPAPGRLRVEPGDGGSVAGARVTNETGLHLDAVLVLQEDRATAVPLGPLGPGRTGSAADALRIVEGFDPGNPFPIRRGDFPWLPEPVAGRYAALASWLVNSRPWASGPVALAFTRADAGILPLGRRALRRDVVVLVQPLPLTAPQGRFRVPAGAAAPLLVEGNQAGPPSPGRRTEWYLLPGPATFRFRLPLPAGARVERLTARSRTLFGSGPAPRVDVYRWDTASWERLPAGTGDPPLSPAKHLSTAGDVLLRVTVEQPSEVSLAVEAEGVVEP